MIALLLASIITVTPGPREVERRQPVLVEAAQASLSSMRHIRDSIKPTITRDRIPTRLTPIWERIPPPMPSAYTAVVLDASEVYLTIVPHRCLGVIGNGEIVAVEVPETGDGYVVARFEKDGQTWRFFIKRDKLEVLP